MAIFISASMLNDFVHCNRMVYYRINHPELQTQNKEMIIGEVVHSAIEKFWDLNAAGCFYAIEELRKRLPEHAESTDFSLDCLHIYYSNFQKLLTYNDTVEAKFKVQYDKDVFIVGKMDRISDGKVFDWKTTRKPPTNIDKDIQFILYNWAFKEIYNAEPSGVYYASLTNGSLIKYNKNPIVQDFLLGEVVPQLISTIRSKNYIHNGVFKRSCYRCVYSDTCLKEV